MAKQVRTVIDVYDDIDHTLIPEGAGETLIYVWDGNLYEIDLTDAHADEVRNQLRPLLSASRKVGRVSAKALAPASPMPRNRRTPADKPAPAALPAPPAEPKAWLTERPEDMSQWQWNRRRRSQFRVIREWARDNGFPDQKITGKMLAGVREAWNAAHPDQPMPDEMPWREQH